MSETDANTESWNDRVIREFRAGDERPAGMFDRSSLLLLHTTGARSGQQRTNPLAYFADGDRLLIVASAAGRPTNPDWFHNIRANPQVMIEVWDGDELDSFTATATPTDAEERDRLFAEIVAKAPGFGSYQEQTSRVIPVVSVQRI